MPDDGHWNAELFRTEGHRMIDWIADYLAGGARELPVLAQVEPGDIAARLPAGMPEHAESPEAVWSDFIADILPGVTHWNHPGFMAYFGITGSGPGILGDLMSTALNVNGMLWRTCPSCTELELKVLEWLRDGVGLPAGLFGFFCDTASVSSLLSLAAARESADPEIRRRGMSHDEDRGPFRVYASDQAHSSIAKACITLGFGLDGVRSIRHDDEYRMDVDALAAAIAEDREAGFRPLAVVATVGTTSTTSVDPVAEIGELCRREQLWLHVDAAYAGSAAMCPEHRWIFAGAEAVDSLVFNPHKWLFTPFDASALYTSRPELFRRAFSLVPEYLTTPVSGTVVDLMDYGIQLGRRFRALKLWWVLRCFGAEGIRQRLRSHIAMASDFADWVDDHPDFERLAPAPFSVVCFRARPNGVDDGEALDRLNLHLMERVNRSGSVYLSHTRLDPGISLRVAIGNLGTTSEDVRCCRSLLEKELECLCHR